MTEQKKWKWDNLRCLYAEDLQNKRCEMIVAAVRDTPKDARLFSAAGESEAWDVGFEHKDKEGKRLYIQLPKPNKYGKPTSLLRTYRMALGGDPSEEHVGGAIVLYPIKSTRSVSGQAIRVAMPEHLA